MEMSLGVHFPGFERHIHRGIVGAAEAVDADGLAAQLLRLLDLRPGNDLERELILQSCDDHHRCAARRSDHRRGGCRLSELKTAAEQSLDVRRARLDQDDFQIDAVLLAESQFLIDPQGKLVAGGAAVTG
jgi:hypothetical protein